MAATLLLPLATHAQSGASSGVGFSIWHWLIPIAVAIIVARYFNAYRRRYLSLPTLEQYLAAHPDCAMQAGRVLCHVCRSNSIYVQWVYRTADGSGPKTHLCRTCGTSLWRSG